MKYKERDALVKGLRELADFVEERGIELPSLDGDLALTGWVSEYSSDYSRHDPDRPKRVLRKAAKVMGKCKKNFNAATFSITRDFGPVTLKYFTNRRTVCEKRVVEVVHVPEEVIAAHDREVVEWICTDAVLFADATSD